MSESTIPRSGSEVKRKGSFLRFKGRTRSPSPFKRKSTIDNDAEERDCIAPAIGKTSSFRTRPSSPFAALVRSFSGKHKAKDENQPMPQSIGTPPLIPPSSEKIPNEAETNDTGVAQDIKVSDASEQETSAESLKEKTQTAESATESETPVVSSSVSVPSANDISITSDNHGEPMSITIDADSVDDANSNTSEGEKSKEATEVDEEVLQDVVDEKEDCQLQIEETVQVDMVGRSQISDEVITLIAPRDIEPIKIPDVEDEKNIKTPIKSEPVESEEERATSAENESIQAAFIAEANLEEAGHYEHTGVQNEAASLDISPKPKKTPTKRPESKIQLENTDEERPDTRGTATSDAVKRDAYATFDVLLQDLSSDVSGDTAELYNQYARNTVPLASSSDESSPRDTSRSDDSTSASSDDFSSSYRTTSSYSDNSDSEGFITGCENPFQQAGSIAQWFWDEPDVSSKSHSRSPRRKPTDPSGKKKPQRNMKKKPGRRPPGAKGGMKKGEKALKGKPMTKREKEMDIAKRLRASKEKIETKQKPVQNDLLKLRKKMKPAGSNASLRSDRSSSRNGEKKVDRLAAKARQGSSNSSLRSERSSSRRGEKNVPKAKQSSAASTLRGDSRNKNAVKKPERVRRNKSDQKPPVASKGDTGKNSSRAKSRPKARDTTPNDSRPRKGSRQRGRGLLPRLKKKPPSDASRVLIL